MGVRVVTDSACDLPQELIDELQIEVVPLTIRFGSEELIDREQLSTAEFWRSAALVAGAARDGRAVGRRVRGLLPQADRRRRDGDRVHQPLVASLGDDAGRAARRGVGGGQLPGGGRRLAHVLDGSRRAVPDRGTGAPLTGAPLEKIVDEVINRRDRTRLFGALDTLEYLKKGGRVGNARALLGSMLSIKPVVEVRNGVVEEAGKVRTRSKSLQAARRQGAGAARSTRWRCCTARPTTSASCSTCSTDAFPRDQIVTGVVGPGHRHARGAGRHRRHVPGTRLTHRAGAHRPRVAAGLIPVRWRGVEPRGSWVGCSTAGIASTRSSHEAAWPASGWPRTRSSPATWR